MLRAAKTQKKVQKPIKTEKKSRQEQRLFFTSKCYSYVENARKMYNANP